MISQSLLIFVRECVLWHCSCFGQGGDQCSCADQFDYEGATAGCIEPCSGDAEVTCGGLNKRFVYKLGGGQQGAVFFTWWRHQMETFSALLTICTGNSPGEFPTQRPVTRSFDVLFDLDPNKRLSKQSWGWWFETPSWSLWRHSNEYPIRRLIVRSREVSKSRDC